MDRGFSSSERVQGLLKKENQYFVLRIKNNSTIKMNEDETYEVWSEQRKVQVRLAGLFHSKYIFEYATTKASETLSLSHVLKAMIAIQIKGKVSCDCPRLNESNGANATSIFYAG